MTAHTRWDLPGEGHGQDDWLLDHVIIAPQELVGDYPASERLRLSEYLEGGRLLASYLGYI
jgi:hypothetical protein